MNYSKKVKIQSIRCMLEHIISSPELDHVDTIDFDNSLYKVKLLNELSHAGLDMVIAEIEEASDLKWKEFLGDVLPIHMVEVENPTSIEDDINYEDFFQTYWAAEIDYVPNVTKFVTHFYKSSTQNITEIINNKPIEVWHAVSLRHYDNTDETHLNFTTRIPYLSIQELKRSKNLRPATPDEIRELNEKWSEHQIESEQLIKRMEAKRNDKREI